MSALVELSNSPLVSIGCHTHYHQALSSIPETDAQHDLSMGKRNLEKWTGNQIDHFSYPYGKVNHRIAKMVQSTGFKTAVTTKPGVERIGFNDPFNISRFEIKKLDDFLSTTRILER
jgi:peptidoglycan/xylan/chitin deacetylase (PgdA/CDA1 family)